MIKLPNPVKTVLVVMTSLPAAHCLIAEFIANNAMKDFAVGYKYPPSEAGVRYPFWKFLAPFTIAVLATNATKILQFAHHKESEYRIS